MEETKIAKKTVETAAQKESKKRAKQFLAALDEMVDTKGLSEDIIIDALKEAFTKAYTKNLESKIAIDPTRRAIKSKNKDGIKLSDALVRCEIDLKKGNIELFHQLNVMKDDDITDDFIEISEEDPRAKENHLNAGDIYEEQINLKDFTAGDVYKFVGVFRQKISKAEKDALYAKFSDKIGQIVTAVVEKVDFNDVIINLDKENKNEGAVAYLYKKDLIGDEHFNAGDYIKVFIVGIGTKSDDKKETTIQVSRSCPGFLEKIFENEVHEIMDGTVKIKNIARIAGQRSKVVVYSTDKNVDPSGACIGQNGSRIQSIVSQLGNAKDNKEKIDVITYNDNVGLYLAECLKPATVLGMIIDEVKRSAIVVCQDGTTNLAIGHRGNNVVLAKKLLGYEEIKVIDEATAIKDDITFKTMAQFEVEARDAERIKNRVESLKKQEEAQKNAVVSPKVEVEPSTNENFLSKDEDIEDIESVEEEPAKETTVEKPVEKVEEPVETRTVNTTISLDALEASLEDEKKDKKDDFFKKKPFKKFDKKNDKPVEKTEEKSEEKKTNGKKMDIYTEEELKAMENDENENQNLDEDFSDYDDDSYYEDK